MITHARLCRFGTLQDAEQDIVKRDQEKAVQQSRIADLRNKWKTAATTIHALLKSVTQLEGAFKQQAEELQAKDKELKAQSRELEAMDSEIEAKRQLAAEQEHYEASRTMISNTLAMAPASKSAHPSASAPGTRETTCAKAEEPEE